MEFTDILSNAFQLQHMLEALVCLVTLFSLVFPPQGVGMSSP